MRRRCAYACVQGLFVYEQASRRDRGCYYPSRLGRDKRWKKALVHSSHTTNNYSTINNYSFVWLLSFCQSFDSSKQIFCVILYSLNRNQWNFTDFGAILITISISALSFSNTLILISKSTSLLIKIAEKQWTLTNDHSCKYSTAN